MLTRVSEEEVDTFQQTEVMEAGRTAKSSFLTCVMGMESKPTPERCKDKRRSACELSGQDLARSKCSVNVTHH